MKTEKTDPIVPETLDGWAVLHEIYQIHWPSWKRVPEAEQKRALAEAVEFLQSVSRPKEGSSAAFSLLGHKGDLLLLHFRPSFDELNQLELGFRQLHLTDYLEESNSYLSYVEMGMYEMTVTLHARLLGEGLKPGTEEWGKRWREEMEVQKERMKERIWPAIPDDRYLSFYPMNKHRGEQVNWYSLPMEKRQALMREHGLIGRKYAGRVTQVITGSIGFDDWEWGVYLFAKDPLVFKKLIYEMRFDEASSAYGEFGPFYSGLRFAPERLPDLFAGKVP